MRGIKKKFTDNFLNNLKIKEYNYDIRECDGRGFAVRVNKTGTISFIFFYNFDGKKRRMTIGQYPYLSYESAKKIHLQSLIKLENGVDPALRKQLRIIDTHKRLHK